MLSQRAKTEKVSFAPQIDEMAGREARLHCEDALKQVALCLFAAGFERLVILS